MNKKEEIIKIKDYYDKANKLIKSNDINSAAKLIHDTMGPKLYDISLDIMYNTNDSNELKDLPEEEFIENKQLKSLITRVNKALNKESIDNFDSDEPISASDINSNDKEWFSDQVI